MKQILFSTLFAVGSVGSLFSMKHELEKKSQQWAQGNPKLLNTLRSRNLYQEEPEEGKEKKPSLAAKNAELGNQGYTNLSDYNYVFKLAFDEGDVVVRIPSERTRFVEFICSKGLEARLNEGNLTQEEIQSLRREFEQASTSTVQGVSQAAAYQLLMGAYASGVLLPEHVVVPRMWMCQYPDASIKINRETDDTHFVVQEFHSHAILTNQDVAALSMNQLKALVEHSWQGQIWNLIKGQNPEELTNIGRDESGKLVITDLEKPNRIVSTDDTSRREIFMVNGLEGILKVVDPAKRAALIEWMRNEYLKEDCFTQGGSHNSYEYFIKMLERNK